MVLLIALALITIFSPEWAFLKKAGEFSVQLMIGYLFLGLGFLVIGNKRLLLTSFACCGALCLFLKQSSNEHLRLPEQTKEEMISIAHFNTSSASDGYASLVQSALESEADIISFQEVTPDWDIYLKQNLSETYPFFASNVRIDPYGMAFFSKIPIENYDTFHYQDIPHQMANISISENKQVNIISAHVLPPVGQVMNERAKMHLNTIAEIIQGKPDPSIVLGDFNLVYWSNEIRDFRNKADLANSRRDIASNLFKIPPYDHIFFSEELECTGFQDISDTISNHLGIIGSYQFKNPIVIREGKVPGLFSE